MSEGKSPGPKRRGITAAYQTGSGLFGDTPQYQKEAETLRKAWENKERDPKSREAFERDARIHKKPVSRLQINNMKAQRQKPGVQSRLIPKGPGAAPSRNAQDAERERKIHFQEKRLGRQQGIAKQDFKRSNRSQFRGPMQGPQR